MLNSTGTIWGSWAAVAAAIFSGLGFGYAIYKWLKRKWKLRNTFDVSYNPPICGRQIVYPNEKELGVQIQLKIDVYVKAITFQFIPQGNNTPDIRELHDADWPYGKPAGVRINDMPTGEIEWRYNNPQYQGMDSIIRVGIKYIASHPFTGNLCIRLVIYEGVKEKCLPFCVCEDKKDG